MLLDNVKELCAKKKISIKKLEKESGLSNGTIGKWDKSDPSISSVQKVAKYFNVTVNRLLRETEQ